MFAFSSRPTHYFFIPFVHTCTCVSMYYNVYLEDTYKFSWYTTFKFNYNPTNKFPLASRSYSYTHVRPHHLTVHAINRRMSDHSLFNRKLHVLNLKPTGLILL